MAINISRNQFFAIAFVCLVLGVISARQLLAAFYDAPLAPRVLQLLPEPRPLPQVMLRTAAGDAFPREKFLGKWNLVFFGFTSCPDFCPLELQKLGKLLTLTQGQADIRIVFVSVDPERDLPERLGQYVHFFNPAIVGLRGDNPAIASLARFFGAAYERSAIINSKLLHVPAGAALPEGVGENYQVNHSTRVFVVDPQGQYLGSFANVDSAEILWGDLQLLF